MSRTIQDKRKPLNRVRRTEGRVDAIERALEEEQGCAGVLQWITSCRGATNGLPAIVMEDHIRTRMIDLEDTPCKRGPSATDQLV